MCFSLQPTGDARLQFSHHRYGSCSVHRFRKNEHIAGEHLSRFLLLLQSQPATNTEDWIQQGLSLAEFSSAGGQACSISADQQSLEKHAVGTNHILESPCAPKNSPQSNSRNMRRKSQLRRQTNLVTVSAIAGFSDRNTTATQRPRSEGDVARLAGHMVQRTLSSARKSRAGPASSSVWREIG